MDQKYQVYFDLDKTWTNVTSWYMRIFALRNGKNTKNQKNNTSIYPPFKFFHWVLRVVDKKNKF